MAVLWAGGEDLSYQNGGIPLVATTSGYFRTGYARCALQAPESINAVKGNTYSGGAITSAWRSFQIAFGNNSGVTYYFGGVGQSTSQKCLIVGNGTSNGSKVTLYKYDGTTYTALAAESGVSIPLGFNLFRIDMQIINYGATATVNVYFAGVLVITFSGDVTVSGMSSFDCNVFGPGGVGGANEGVYFSEDITANEDTRTFSLFTQSGTGTGWADQWSGSYTDCNPIIINEANSVYTVIASQDEAFALTSLPSGTFSIKAVLEAAFAEKTSGSPVGTLKLGWYTSSTVGVDGGHSLTTGWACYENLALTNPVTSTNWTQSDISSLQIDMQSAT